MYTEDCISPQNSAELNRRDTNSVGTKTNSDENKLLLSICSGYCEQFSEVRMLSCMAVLVQCCLGIIIELCIFVVLHINDTYPIHTGLDGGRSLPQRHSHFAQTTGGNAALQQ